MPDFKGPGEWRRKAVAAQSKGDAKKPEPTPKDPPKADDKRS